MTMLLQVKNCDQTNLAEVYVRDHNPDDAGELPLCHKQTTLSPGEQCDVHVHTYRDLLVREVIAK